LRDQAIQAFAKVQVIANKELKNAKLLDDSSGLSSVYKAVWNTQKVCVKLPRNRITRDEFHEYTIIGSIPLHENVLSLVGVSCDFLLHTSRVCLVTPYMEAGSVDKLYRTIGSKLGKPGARPEDKTQRTKEVKAKVMEILLKKGFAAVALDMAKGLSHLHENQNVHRDIAARNFLVDRNGKVVVSDFGLSRKLENRDLNNTNEQKEEEVYMMSKPHDRLPVRWMAPETLPNQGTLGVYDKKTDVWSFGVTLWELAHYCLLLPYRNKDNSSVMRGVAKSELILEFETCDVSESFRSLVRLCMDRNPEKRPTMEKIVEILRKMIEENNNSSSSSTSSSTS